MRNHESRGDDIKKKQDEEYEQAVREEAAKLEEKANKERQEKVCSTHCCSTPTHSFKTQSVKTHPLRRPFIHSYHLSPSFAYPTTTFSKKRSFISNPLMLYLLISHLLILCHIISTHHHIISTQSMTGEQSPGRCGGFFPAGIVAVQSRGTRETKSETTVGDGELCQTAASGASRIRALCPYPFHHKTTRQQPTPLVLLFLVDRWTIDQHTHSTHPPNTTFHPPFTKLSNTPPRLPPLPPPPPPPPPRLHPQCPRSSNDDSA